MPLGQSENDYTVTIGLSLYERLLYSGRDDPIQAIENGQRALAIAGATEDFGLQIQANHFLGAAHRMIGDYERAINHFRTDIESPTSPEQQLPW